MAEAFIGLQMEVTLRDPPVTVKGTIKAVDPGSGLTIVNVWWLGSQRWAPQLQIPTSNIANVVQVPVTPATDQFTPAPQVAPAHAPAPVPPAPHVQPPSATFAPQNAPASITPTAPFAPVFPAAQQAHVPTSAPAFVDPAILSMGKRPGSQNRFGSEPQGHATTAREAHTVLPTGIVTGSGSRNATPTGTVLEEPMKNVKLEEPQDATEESGEEAAAVSGVQYQESPFSAQKKKRNRRPKRNGFANEVEASPQPPRILQQQQAGRGKGWRQTPMLQSPSSFQPFNSLKKAPKGPRANDNGWASEDVTDIQEMGDFNFEEGLTKFDKHNLFEQMRKDDQTDDADRLVTHNRQPRPKPGTAGGKNLHYSENVLDLPPTQPKPPITETSADFWNSEADDGTLNGAGGGGERLSGRDQGSRQGSRRGESKVSATRRSQSRKASAAMASAVGTGAAGVVGQGPHRVNSGLANTSVAAAPAAVANPSASNQGLYLYPSNRRVEPVSPLQMLNLENIAHNDVGLTEAMMTENAARGIAEVTLTVLRDPAIQVRHVGTADPSSGIVPPPTIVVLAGNNKSGIRAVAAARHLRNKGANVLVCVVGIERGERDLLEDMLRQVRLYRNYGGRVFGKVDLFEHIRKLSMPALTIDTPRSSSLASLANPAPVTLIMDALLGLAVPFDELSQTESTTTYELIEWANRNEAFVLAVDVPTGVDPSTGKVSVVDGNRLYLKPRYVVAVGAPKRGLFEVLAIADAAAADEEAETVVDAQMMPDDSPLEWKLYLADMGLGSSVWKKSGTKIRRGIDFDDRWVLEMRFVGNAYDVDEVA